MTTLCVLCSQGDIRVTWDHADPASVENARKEVMDLKAAGFMFYLVDGTPADEVAAGQGALDCRRVTAEQLLEAEPPVKSLGEPVGGEPIQEPAPRDNAPVKSRRGRPAKATPEHVAGETVAVAVPRQRGG